MHSAVHKVATPDIIEESEYCPLCFGPAEKCPISLFKTSRPPQPLVLCGTYAPGVSFQAGSLKKSTTSAPSTNHPVDCPACDSVVWSYNMDAHWKRLHKTIEMPPDFRDSEDIKLTAEEIDRLRKLGEKQIK